MAEQISLSNTLYQQIKRYALRNQQTIDDYVADLISSAIEQENELPILDDASVSKEAAAWAALHPMLKTSYAGQHVAIFEGKVVDADVDALTLHQRIRTQYDEQAVWMSFVAELPFEEIVMRSPRLDR